MEALSDKVWTYEDYCQLPDDGKRYEIIDGTLYVTPAPVNLHQLFSGRLFRVLAQLEDRGLGWVFSAPCDVRMPGADPVQPDLVFVSAEQSSIIIPKWIQGVPKLLVELLSPSSARYDRVTKLNKYASCGVPHYWLGDPALRTIELLHLDEMGYRVLASLGPGDRFEHPDFAGLTLDIDALFANLPPGLED